MDLYNTWENNSGTNTPNASVADLKGAAGDGTASASSSASTSTLPATSSGTASADGAAKSPTIEQELEQMGKFVGGMSKNLGSYWGQFRKQSVTAIQQSSKYASELAAKDFQPYLDKAKAELAQLSEQAKASAQAGQAAALEGGHAINPDAPILAVKSETTLARDGEPGSASDPDKQGEGIDVIAGISSSQAAQNATAFFNRLQAQVKDNPNFQSFQHNIHNVQDQLKSQSHKIDFSKIDLQEATKRAEKAMNTGEKYWKTASKDLQDWLGEAVKIVPPSASGEGSMKRGISKQEDRKKAAALAAAGRKETLLHRVRSDSQVLLVDPAESASSPTSAEDAAPSHTDSTESFKRFLADKVETQERGIDSADWKAKIATELEADQSGSLKANYDSIVPKKLTPQQFWTRYFFRVHQIDEDEARRREILEGALAQQAGADDDFSWDMEDDDEEGLTSSSPNVAATPEGGKGKAKAMAGSDAAEQAHTMVPGGSKDEREKSPRQSSEEEGTTNSTSSYDVVSATSGNPSTPSSPKGTPTAFKPLKEATPTATTPAAKASDDDEDSDWE